MNRLNLILIGSLAASLLFAGMATARDYDGHRRGGDDRNAHRVDRRLDHRGAAINHHLDVAAFAAAVFGDIHLAYALDRHGDRIEIRYDRHGDRIVHAAHRAPHRHHDRCGHHRSTWRSVNHHVPHARAHGYKHGYGHGKGHHKGHGHNKHGKHRGRH